MDKLIHPATAPRLALVARCAELLAALRQDSAGVVSATVATSDGLAVASTLAGKAEVDKLAAISGSIAALATVLTQEAGHGEPERVILGSDSGHVVSMKIPGNLVLTVVTDRHAVLGKLLWDCRATTARLAAAAQAAD